MVENNPKQSHDSPPDVIHVEVRSQTDLLQLNFSGAKDFAPANTYEGLAVALTRFVLPVSKKPDPGEIVGR